MIHPVQRNSTSAANRALPSRFMGIVLMGLLLTTQPWNAKAAEPAYTLLAYNSVSVLLNPLAVDRLSRLEPASVAAVPASPTRRFSAELSLQVPEPAADLAAEDESDERYFGELTRSGNGGLFGEGCVMLLQTRLPTRFSYRSWAGLHSGYGRVFSSPDTIGRSCANGAGVDDASCFYLKMSFNF